MGRLPLESHLRRLREALNCRAAGLVGVDETVLELRAQGLFAPDGTVRQQRRAVKRLLDLHDRKTTAEMRAPDAKKRATTAYVEQQLAIARSAMAEGKYQLARACIKSAARLIGIPVDEVYRSVSRYPRREP